MRIRIAFASCFLVAVILLLFLTRKSQFDPEPPPTPQLPKTAFVVSKTKSTSVNSPARSEEGKEGKAGTSLLLSVRDKKTKGPVEDVTFSNGLTGKPLDVKRVVAGQYRTSYPHTKPLEYVEVNISAPGYVPQDASAEVEDGKATLTMTRWAELHGLVIEEETEKPVPGAEIIFQSNVYTFTPGKDSSPVGGVRKATSDVDGAFTVIDVDPRYSYSIRATASGYVPKEGHFESIVSGQNDYTIALKRACPLTITFNDQNGTPLGDYSVRLQYEKSKNHFTSDHSGITDAEGQVTFLDVPFGTKWAQLRYKEPGLMFVNVFELAFTACDSAFTFTTTNSPTLLVSVTIDETGEPAPNRELMLSPLDAPGALHVRSATDEQGMCRFVGVHLGRAYLMIPAGGGYRLVTDYRVEIAPSGVTEKQYTLKRRPNRQLEVDATALLPFASEGECLVSVYKGTVFRCGRGGEPKETFSFEKLNPGEYSAEAVIGERWWASNPVRLEETGTATVVLKPVPSTEVFGYIVDEAGEPIAGAAVAHSKQSKSFGYPEVKTAPGGGFRLRFPTRDPPGFLHARAFHPETGRGSMTHVALKDFKNGDTIILKRPKE